MHKYHTSDTCTHIHVCMGDTDRQTAENKVIDVTRTQTMALILITIGLLYCVLYNMHHHVIPQQPCMVKTYLAWSDSFNCTTTNSKLHTLASPLLCLMSMELICTWDPS